MVRRASPRPGRAARAGRQERHRGRLRQGRRRQEHRRVNLAVALAQAGATVGLLDADITGPNIPLMIGPRRPAVGQPRQQDRAARALRRQGHLDPVLRPRGPADRLARPARGRRHPAVPARRRLGRARLPRRRPAARHVRRAADARPGGARSRGAVLVTTPQDVALLDVDKALAMFKRMTVPVLGLVENMNGVRLPALRRGDRDLRPRRRRAVRARRTGSTSSAASRST